MSVTIKDVAKRANVAPSTVSRVLSDSPKISEKTKRKVRKAIDELGYHLNYNARVLVQRSTKTIGIVMKNSTSESLHNPFVPEVIRGISSFCRQHDYSINLATGESEEAIFEDTVKMVQGQRVDGLIVLYSKADDKVVPYLADHSIPFVVIGRPLIESSKIMSVNNDNVQAAKEATNYLISLGHEKIGFIGGSPEYEFEQARLSGFLEAMKEQAFDVPSTYIRNVDLDKERGKAATQQLMHLPEPPTAIVTTDDINGLIVLLTLKEEGVRVPEEVSVISFNNTLIAELASPPLTTVDTQTYHLGYESAKSVIELIQDRDMLKKSVIVPTVIVKRESCAPLAAIERQEAEQPK